MNEKNWLLLTDELVEFEEQLIVVLDFGKITDYSREIYGIYLKLVKENETCQHVVNWT